MSLRAFHGDPAVKERYLSRVRAHEAADEIIHGRYWKNGKGCAVGCSVHSASHMAYETKLGIPIMLAWLEDRLFEGMADGDSKKFPARFLSVIEIGADLSCVVWKFLHWLLTEELTARDDPRVAPQIKQCADVLVPLTKGLPIDQQEIEKARAGARTAAAAAAAAAAAYAARAQARSGCYRRMAEKLLELMGAAPLVPYCAGIAA